MILFLNFNKIKNLKILLLKFLTILTKFSKNL